MGNKKINIKNPFVTTIAFAVLAFVRPALGVFLLPLYLEQLTAEALAIVYLSQVVGIFIGIVGTLQINASMRTYYFDYVDDRIQLKKYVSTIFSIGIFFGFIFFIFLLAIGPILFPILFKENSLTFYPYGIMVAGANILAAIKTTYLIYLKNEIRVKEFAVWSLSLVLLSVSLQAYFVLALDLGAIGVLGGALGAQFITTLMLVIYRYDLLTIKPDKDMVRESLKFSLPIMVLMVITWISTRGDRFLVERFLDLNTVGKYVLVVTLGGMVLTIRTALSSAIRPYLYRFFKAGRIEYKKQINAITAFSFWMSGLVSSGIVLVGTNLHFLTKNEDYISTAEYYSLAVLVFYILSYTSAFQLQLYYVKESKVVTRISYISLLGLVLGYFYLIPEYGMYGALIMGLVSNVITTVIFAFVAQREYTVPYQWRKTFFIPFLAVFFILILQYVAIQLGWSYSIFGIVQFLFFIIYVFLFGRSDFIMVFRAAMPGENKKAIDNI